MEIAKYLCEFFFCNFWHWLGLVIALCVFRLFYFNMTIKDD